MFGWDNATTVKYGLGEKVEFLSNMLAQGEAKLREWSVGRDDFDGKQLLVDHLSHLKMQLVDLGQ